MNKKLDTQTLDAALSLLSERLRLNRSEPVNLVICGGSALIAMEFIERATKDVDIVPLIDERGTLTNSRPLPIFLIEAATQVALDLGLDKDWLNDGPGELIEAGLPDGFQDRLTQKKYGTHLRVNFISRFDQIHFKVYAAVDRGPGYHVNDLLAMNPTPDEISAASQWALSQDPSSGFKDVLKEMLSKLGYDSISKTI